MIDRQLGYFKVLLKAQIYQNPFFDVTETSYKCYKRLFVI